MGGGAVRGRGERVVVEGAARREEEEEEEEEEGGATGRCRGCVT